MAEERTTHEVAESTDPDGTRRKVETTRTTETSSSSTAHRPEEEGKPKQVQPDGR